MYRSLAMIAAAAILSVAVASQAAHGVVIKLTSVTKNSNAASTYYFTASSLHMHSLVREKMWW
jgi:hypothetical protein